MNYNTKRIRKYQNDSIFEHHILIYSGENKRKVIKKYTFPLIFARFFNL